MKKIITVASAGTGKMQAQGLTIGVDLGDRSSCYCVLNEEGEIVHEEKVRYGKYENTGTTEYSPIRSDHFGKFESSKPAESSTRRVAHPFVGIMQDSVRKKN